MKANEVFDLVLSVNVNERETYLKELCGDDSSLILQVKRMLAENRTSAGKPDLTVHKTGQMANRTPDNQHDASSREDETKDSPSVGTVHSSIKPESSSLTSGSFVGPYKLRDRLGQGGMGDVWIADQSLPIKRRVALKVIKRGIGSDDILARFDAERQALALMNHPNIARILDAGTSPDGQPYFAMELVSGKPLTNYCDEHRLGINDRLSLFADVCDGVQHAHQKGIIHRDLKPSNIIVGMVDGKAVPKVIDFGLAKALESTQRLTDQSLFTGIGQILGTLKYMSPEQANLDSADVDTRTDIYALGVILYELLTGSTPLDESSIKGQAALKVLEFVRDKEPAKPSSRLGSSTDEQRSSITNQRRTDSVRLNRVLAGDLDWIVMKALEKDRTRRYESASSFGADVNRFLKNEPIVARPPSLSYRMQKFVRKNRTGVIVAGLLGISLLVGLFGTAYGFYRARQSAEAERIAKLDAQDREEEAVLQRTRAEVREQEAIDAVKRFGDVISNNLELKNNPSLGSLRRSLLKEPLAFFQSLRERMESDNDTRIESIQRLAMIGLELAELTTEIGDKKNALALYEKALAIREKLVLDHPADRSMQSKLASVYLSVGGLQMDTGMPTEAIQTTKKGLDILKRLANEIPNTKNQQFELARGYNILGVLWSGTSRPNEALNAFEQARRLQERLIIQNPMELEFQKELAGSLNNIGRLSAEVGKRNDALRAYNEALEIRKRIAKNNPSVPKYEYDLAASQNNIGGFHRMTGDPKKALQAYHVSLQIRQRLVRENSAVTDFQNALAESHYNLGTILGETGKPLEGIRSFEQAIEVYTRLITANPTVTRFQNDLAKVHNNLGNLLRDTGKPTEALEAFQKGLAIQERLARENPTLTDFQNTLAGTFSNIGKLHSNYRRPSEALKAFQKALVIHERLARKNPTVTDFQNSLASDHNLIGNLLNALGKTAEALKAYEKAVEIQTHVTQQNPTVGSYQYLLSLSHNNIGTGMNRIGRTAEARQAFETALEIQQRLSSGNPTTTMFQTAAGVTLQNLAAIEIESSNFAKAKEHLRTAIEYQQNVLAIDPTNQMCRQYLRVHLSTLSNVSARLQDTKMVQELRKKLANLTISDPANSKLEERLMGFEKASVNFKTNELVTLGQFAYDTMRFSLATRLFEQALSKQAALSDDRQKQIAYNAACCAALAAAEEGTEEPLLNKTSKAKLRGQALSWLRAELDLWEKFANEKPEQKVLVQQTLLHWQNDADLESIRDPKQLAKLPEEERNQWENLWKQVKDKTQNDPNADQ